MPKIRARRLEALPPSDEVRRLIREFSNKTNRHKTALLQQLVHDPGTPIPRLAEIIGKSPRTTRRYLGLLREKGVQGFLADSRQKRKLSDDEVERLRAMIRSGELRTLKDVIAWVGSRLDTSYSLSGMHELLRREFRIGRQLREDAEKQGSAHTEASLEAIQGKLVEFLNLLPTTINLREWIPGFRNALRVLLPYAERIGVSVNTSADLTGVRLGTTDMRMLQTIDSSAEAGERDALRLTSVDMRYSTTVDGILAKLRSDGFDFEAYYPPVFREISLARTTYLGTIMVIYPRSGPDFTEAGGEVIDRLRPFLAFCLIDAIARQRVHEPQRREFQLLLDDFSQDHGLSHREREVLMMHVFGIPYEEMSRSLSIAPATIRNHIASIHRKTGAGARGELLALLVGPGGFPAPAADATD